MSRCRSHLLHRLVSQAMKFEKYFGKNLSDIDIAEAAVGWAIHVQGERGRHAAACAVCPLWSDFSLSVCVWRMSPSAISEAAVGRAFHGQEEHRRDAATRTISAV